MVSGKGAIMRRLLFIISLFTLLGFFGSEKKISSGSSWLCVSSHLVCKIKITKVFPVHAILNCGTKNMLLPYNKIGEVIKRFTNVKYSCVNLDKDD